MSPSEKHIDKSILLQMQEQGVSAPRVKLKGTERNDDAAERYEVVGEIARGGVGVVERGRDTDIGRDVALKVLHDRHLRSPELVQRFVEEAQIGGQLQHPGIVPVYELGLRDDQRPFFAMKLVKGETLAAKLGARKDPTDGLRALLAVFREVCRTMAYAHSRGVIHRDLKPSNVMIGNFGEVQVVDWGFAKVLKKGGVADEKIAGKRDRDRTMVSTVRSGSGDESISGSVMGTPAYMPPEQALGRVEDLDERSDVFSLGAILCEILSGQPPYAGSGDDRVAAAAQARLEPALVRLDACGADEDLVALAKRCLEPLPSDRPTSAELLADEVADHLTSAEGRAHRAKVRAVQAGAEAEEQQRRRRQTILVGSAVLAALVIAVGTYFGLDAASTRRANERQAAIEAARQDMSRLFAAANWDRARMAAEQVLEFGSDGGVDTDVLAEAREVATTANRNAEDAAFLAELEAIRGWVGDRSRRSRPDVEEATYTDKSRGDEELISVAAGSVSVTPSTEAICAAYAAAFERRFGSVEASVARLKASPLAPDFSANVGLWGLLLSDLPHVAPEEWKRLSRLAARIDPGNADVRDAIDALDAETLLEITKSRGDDLPRALAAQVGIALAALGHAEDAVAYLERQCLRTPDDFWIHMRLAWAAFELDVDLAVRHSHAAVAIRPEHAGAWYYLGHALYGRGDYADSIAALETLVELDPESPSAHNQLGRSLAKHGDLEAAIAAHERAIELDPGDATAHFNLGVALGTAGHLDGARAAYEKTIALNPDSAMAHNNLGSLRLNVGDLEGAITSYRRAIAIVPDFFHSHLNLGVVLTRSGDFEGAIAALEKAVAIAPESALAYRNLGVVHSTRGDNDSQIAAYRRAVELAPMRADIRTMYGGGLSNAGDLDAALEQLRRAIELDPEHALAFEFLGLTLMKKGNADAAVTAIRRAVELEPDNARFQATLADAEREAALLDHLPAEVRDTRRYASAREAVKAGEPAKALALLRADLSALENVVDKDPALVTATLAQWKQEPDLKPVRSRKARRKLPDEEQEQWAALWADVDTLLDRAR